MACGAVCRSLFVQQSEDLLATQGASLADWPIGGS